VSRPTEDWHRVLKSGCHIDELGHHRADRLKRAIAIRRVIAWRVMLMTLLGREVPELPQLLWHGYTKLTAMTMAYELRDEMEQ